MAIFAADQLPPLLPDSDYGLEIWVDPALSERKDILTYLNAQGAILSTDYESPTTHHLILSSSSLHLFDRYCHPNWLPKHPKIRKARRETWEIWQDKVLLKSAWVGLCKREGRYLGELDNWGGMRAGGPPIKIPTTIAPPRPELYSGPPIDAADPVQHVFAPSPPSPAVADIQVNHDVVMSDADANGRSKTDEQAVITVDTQDSGAGEDGEEDDMDMDMDIEVATQEAVKTVETAGFNAAEGIGMDVDMDMDVAMPPQGADEVGQTVRADGGGDMDVDMDVNMDVEIEVDIPSRPIHTPVDVPAEDPDKLVPIATEQRARSPVTPDLPSRPASAGPGARPAEEGLAFLDAAPIAASATPPPNDPTDAMDGARTSTALVRPSEVIEQPDTNNQVPDTTGGMERVPSQEKQTHAVLPDNPETDEGAETGEDTGIARPAHDTSFALNAEAGPSRPRSERTHSSSPQQIASTQVPARAEQQGSVQETRADATKGKDIALEPLPQTSAPGISDVGNGPAPAPTENAAAPSSTVPAHRQRANAAIALSKTVGTSQVFQGCVVLIPKGKYGRKAYMKMITTGSGSSSGILNTSATREKTTHVVCDETEDGITPFPNIQWNMFIKAGVSFVNYEWITDSVRAGKLMPVERYPPLRRQDIPLADREGQGRAVPRVLGGEAELERVRGSAGPQRMQMEVEVEVEVDEGRGKKKRNPMPTEQLVEIFRAVPEGGRPDYDALAEQYPYYPRTTWSALWSKFKHRTHRFSAVPLDTPVQGVSTPSGSSGVGATTPVKKRTASRSASPMGEDDDDWIPESDSDPNMRAKPNAMSTEQLVEIFSAVPQGAPPDFMELEKEYPVYTHKTWKRMWYTYIHRTHRFSEIDKPGQPDVEIDIDADADDTSDAGITPASGLEPNTKGRISQMSTEDLVAIFARVPPEGKPDYAAWAAKYPFYSYGTWSVMWSLFRNRAKRFRNVPRNLPAPPAARSTTPKGSPSGRDTAPASTSRSPRAAKTASAAARADRTTPELEAIFGAEFEADMDKADRLVVYQSQLPEFTDNTVSILYKDYRKRQGRFAGRRSPRPTARHASVSDIDPIEASVPVSAHRSGGNTTKGPAISTDQILRIFNARYGSGTAKGLPKVAIAGALAAEYPAYSGGTWGNYYGEWIRGTGRFYGFPERATRIPQHLDHRHPANTPDEVLREQTPATAPSEPTSLGRPPVAVGGGSRFSGATTEINLARARLFKGMQDAIRRNPREAANKLGKDPEKYKEYGGYEASTWLRNMTTWMNGTGVYVNLPDELRFGNSHVGLAPTATTQRIARATLSPAASLAPPSARRTSPSISVRPSPSPAPSSRSTMIVELPSSTPRSRTAHLRHAISPSGPAPTSTSTAGSSSSAQAPFTPPVPAIPYDIALRGKLREGSVFASSSPEKRAASSDFSQQSRRKQMRSSYTEQEEAEMAVYVSGRLPHPTEAKAADWAAFTATHTARTPAAWVEHYRQYRARIEALVRKLGGKIPGKRTPGRRYTGRDGSSDVEYVPTAPTQNRSGSTQQQEIIILDSDDE